jgi:hypothetical protein
MTNESNLKALSELNNNGKLSKKLHIVGDNKESKMNSSKKKAAVKEDKPKRKLNSYMKFAMKTRESVKKQMPNASVVEIAKELGKRWGKMTPEEKLEFA